MWGMMTSLSTYGGAEGRGGHCCHHLIVVRLGDVRGQTRSVYNVNTPVKYDETRTLYLYTM